MVTRPARRPGHSLPELLVALVILGAAMAGISSTTMLANRWTGDAVLRQRAVAAAVAVLDSLSSLPDPPVAGSRAIPAASLLLEWDGESGAETSAVTIHVSVRSATTGTMLTVLNGTWSRPTPRIPQ
jgi:prepilin-type N-terminal cleavage/methylation domain-containing protein